MKAGRIIVVVLVVLLVAWGIWAYQNKRVEAPTEVQPMLTTGSNDADLDQDMATIDAQLSAVEQSSTEVDQSFTDESTLK